MPFVFILCSSYKKKASCVGHISVFSYCAIRTTKQIFFKFAVWAFCTRSCEISVTLLHLGPLYSLLNVKPKCKYSVRLSPESQRYTLNSTHENLWTRKIFSTSYYLKLLFNTYNRNQVNTISECSIGRHYVAIEVCTMCETNGLVSCFELYHLIG
jgi:hypothetical protein